MDCWPLPLHGFVPSVVGPVCISTDLFSFELRYHHIVFVCVRRQRAAGVAFLATGSIHVRGASQVVWILCVGASFKTK